MTPIRSEEAYNIHMALMHNWGYWTRRVDAEGDEHPAVEVYDDERGVLATVTLSDDGQDWVITTHRHDPLLLPRRTSPGPLGDAIVHEIERVAE